MKALKLTAKITFTLLSLAAVTYGIYAFQKVDRRDTIDKTLVYQSSFTITKSMNFDFTPSEEEMIESIPEFVTVPEGGLDWMLFAETESVPYDDKTKDGEDINGVMPEFSKKLMSYDGQIVKMQGYMFPLNAKDSQSVFLFGPFPLSCPYHYHVGPALVIEAHAKDKLDFDLAAINITGVLELVQRDDEYNIFYRLRDVELIN